MLIENPKNRADSNKLKENLINIEEMTNNLRITDKVKSIFNIKSYENKKSRHIDKIVRWTIRDY